MMPKNINTPPKLNVNTFAGREKPPYHKNIEPMTIEKSDKTGMFLCTAFVRASVALRTAICFSHRFLQAQMVSTSTKQSRQRPRPQDRQSATASVGL